MSSKRISVEAKKIEVVKEWPELNSIRNIQVFLGFANFYWQFIQGFSKIAASLTLILKTTNKPAPSRNDGSKSTAHRNDNSRPASKRNNNDGKVNGFGDGGIECAKKSGKSKGQKTFKSQKLAKFKKH